MKRRSPDYSLTGKEEARLLRSREARDTRNDNNGGACSSTLRSGLVAGVLSVISALAVPCISGSAPRDTAQAVVPASPPAFSDRVIEIPRKAIRAGRDTITISVEAPRGYHLTDEAPSSLCWYADNGKVVSFPKSCKAYKAGSIRFPFKLIIDTKPGQSMLTLDANVFYCENKTKVCMFDKFRIKAPLEVNGRGPTSATVSVEVEVLEDKTP
ncbi:MAG: hypothetical protein HY851_00070 [candidate division Zixibacteria bacterium]|nr:hypothetical protein [candidate division Zixibacteria bacterium]